ncbi:hypothetical protein KK137_06700 [Croceibacterium sp. LX-88]|uniref:Glycerophosphoryl diester phosphodiesterase membrane domain-containing protein n=1 Tax=Croceibacterium selenioxidans TaxID=2838833 RepID=A0ABS5W6J9_9SPHN|nr:hypothetical protein [Croceibacterium selenioxidans]MBT2134019.1 hypothetical protein [Croceibacterium selenioxidans]
MRNAATFSGIFQELVSLIGDARRDVAVYTLVVGGLTAIGVVLGLTETSSGTISYGFSVDANDTPASALFELVAAVVSIVATYVLLTRYLAARGQLQSEEGRFWPYLGMAIVSMIAAFIGLIFLIIPGVILLVRWSAASGYLIGARRGVFESLSASWHATKGNGWAIFFVSLVLLFGFGVIVVLVSGVFTLAGETVGGIISSFVEAAVSGVYAGLGIAIYSLVHDEAGELDEVFA